MILSIAHKEMDFQKKKRKYTKRRLEEVDDTLRRLQNELLIQEQELRKLRVNNSGPVTVVANRFNNA